VSGRERAGVKMKVVIKKVSLSFLVVTGRTHWMNSEKKAAELEEIEARMRTQQDAVTRCRRPSETSSFHLSPALPVQGGRRSGTWKVERQGRASSLVQFKASGQCGLEASVYFAS
jgi:hypothetical protein